MVAVFLAVGNQGMVEIQKRTLENRRERRRILFGGFGDERGERGLGLGLGFGFGV